MTAHLSSIAPTAFFARVDHVSGEHLCRRVRVSQRPIGKTHRFTVATSEVHGSLLAQPISVIWSPRLDTNTRLPRIKQLYRQHTSTDAHQGGLLPDTPVDMFIPCDDNRQKKHSDANDFTGHRNISHLREELGEVRGTIAISGCAAGWKLLHRHRQEEKGVFSQGFLPAKKQTQIFAVRMNERTTQASSEELQNSARS